MKCEVNLLVNFEEADDIYDWDIGTHGIIVKFDGRQSTYLPSVAMENGFSKEETINKLIKKAGYRGNPKNVIDNVKVTRYESSLFEITYMDYMSYNIPTQTYVHEKYLLRWKTPFKFNKKTKSGKTYMLSDKMDINVGNHGNFSSLTLDLVSHKLIIVSNLIKEIDEYDSKFIERLLNEQKTMKDVTVLFPKMCWGFYNNKYNIKVLCFNALGISKDPIPIKGIETVQNADIKIISNFTAIIIKNDGSLEVKGTVLDVFNPWVNKAQRRAIWVKRSKSRGKKRKYYDRMIRRWDKHTKKF